MSSWSGRTRSEHFNDGGGERGGGGGRDDRSVFQPCVVEAGGERGGDGGGGPSRFGNDGRHDDYGIIQPGFNHGFGGVGRFGVEIGGMGSGGGGSVGGIGSGGSGAFRSDGGTSQGMLGRNRLASSHSLVSAERTRSAFYPYKPTNPFDLRTPSNPRNVKPMTAGLRR